MLYFGALMWLEQCLHIVILTLVGGTKMKAFIVLKTPEQVLCCAKAGFNANALCLT